MAKYYSDLKIFHFDEKLKDMASGALSAPIHIRLKPTNRCNHHCTYCCYRSSKLFLSELFNEPDEIPWVKMQEIINDIERMGVKAVTFSGGGEPLSYSYITDTVEQLIKAGIKIAFLTNGSLLNGKIAELLGQSASWVRISMDAADRESYSKIRRVEISEFDKVCENIRQFSRCKNKSCELGVNFIVSKKNSGDVYKFLELMKGLGINHVKVSECVISTKEEENKRYCADFVNLVKEQIAAGFSNLVDNHFNIVDKFCHFDDNDNNYKKYYAQCPMLQCLTVIAADMNVYSCQDKAYTKQGMIGSIKDCNFKDMWFSSETKERLLSLNPSKECRHHCTQHIKNIDLLEYMDVNTSHLEFV